MTDDKSVGADSPKHDPANSVGESTMATTPLEPPAGDASEPQQPDHVPVTPAPRKWWQRDRSRPPSFWRELPILIVVAFVLAVLIKTFLFAAYSIPSGSMEKTLHGCPGCQGDRIAVNKVVYHFRDPKPGDIVVFKAPDSWNKEVSPSEPGNPVSQVFRWLGQLVGVENPGEHDFVKRVIAVGGQTVACCDDQDRVLVDGKPLNEPYIFSDDPGLAQMRFGPVTVPPGRLWLMGDHRNDSSDSRFNQDDGHQGTLDKNAVIGKAFAIAWPPSRWNTLGDPHLIQSMGPVDKAATVAAPYGLAAVGVLPVGLWRYRRHRRRS